MIGFRMDWVRPPTYPICISCFVVSQYFFTRSWSFTVLLQFCLISAWWQQFHNPVVPPKLRTGVFLRTLWQPVYPHYWIWRVSRAMAISYTASKQSVFSTNEYVNSFENWKENLLYTLPRPELCVLPYKWFSVGQRLTHTGASRMTEKQYVKPHARRNC